MKKLITLITAIFAVAGTAQADAPTWSDIDWTSSGKAFSNYESQETLIEKGSEAFSIGDVITVTFSKTTSGSAAAVDLRANYTSKLSQYYNVSSTPSQESFQITARERDAFNRYGLAITGNNITVTKVTKTTGSYTGDDNSVWIGSSSEWNSIAKEVFSDIKAGDRIVANMSKTGSNNGFTFGYKDSNWNDQSFTSGTAYIVTSTKATLYITETLATTIRNSNGLVFNGNGNYTCTSVDLITEPQTATRTYAPEGGWTFEGNSNHTIPSEYLKGLKEGDKMIFTVSDISGTAKYGGTGTDAATVYHRLSLAEGNWSWIGWVNESISSTGDIEVAITEQMLTANKSLPLILAGSNCKVTSIKFQPVNVSIDITSAKYATYSCEQAIDFTGKDVKAYYASEKSSGKVTLTQINKVPANTGLILYCETAGTYSIPVTSESTETITTNYLKPNVAPATIAASTSGTYHYIFAQKDSDEPTFYKLEAAHTLAAHKAYLETDTDITPTGVGAPRRITLDFGNGTTAVLPIENDFVGQQNLREDGVYYTLQGTRVQNPSKGLYILNGKKVLVK